MTKIEDLEREIQKINERNSQVEKDKAWETSYARRLLLIVFTYLAIAIYLFIIEVPRPWLNAIIPSVAFMLSTLTLPFFKNMWLKHRK